MAFYCRVASFKSCFFLLSLLSALASLPETETVLLGLLVLLSGGGGGGPVGASVTPDRVASDILWAAEARALVT